MPFQQFFATGKRNVWRKCHCLCKKYYLGKKTVKSFEDIVSRNSKEKAYFVWGV